MYDTFELNCAYMKMYSRSYRPDGKELELSDEYNGLLHAIRYPDSDCDDGEYFNNIKREFIDVMAEVSSEEHANSFTCRMENGEFIAETFWKFVDDGTKCGDYVTTDDINEADEIERYDVTFFYVTDVSFLDNLK